MRLRRVRPLIEIEIVKRSDQVSSFVVLPKRWIVESTIAWLNRCRRLAGIGSASTERRWRSCASPQSASCSENSAIRPEVSGQTLTRAREVFLNYAHLRGARVTADPPAAMVATLGSGLAGPRRFKISADVVARCALQDRSGMSYGVTPHLRAPLQKAAGGVLDCLPLPCLAILSVIRARRLTAFPGFRLLAASFPELRLLAVSRA